MGLFASRPEEPTEWAGIPSEPHDSGSLSEHLQSPVAASIDAVPADDVLQSIVIPIPQQEVTSRVQETAEPEDASGRAGG